MDYYRDHQYTSNIRAQFSDGSSPQVYGAIVGTIDQSTEHPIHGRNGDHLQFYVNIDANTRYQVDVNSQSRDGSDVQMYIAVEPLTPVSPSQPFGTPDYGVVTTAQLSYQGMGLSDSDFTPTAYDRVDSQLETALNASSFVTIYGHMFDDGGSNGKGIHETHYTGITNQDGAIAIYSLSDTGAPQRTWFFFKFQEDHIGEQAAS